MFSEKSEGLVDALVSAEYYNAVEHYGDRYGDKVESVEVLEEEVNEAYDEMKNVHAFFTFYKNITGPNEPFCLDDLMLSARNAIKELAQVIVVCKKIQNGLEEALTFEDYILEVLKSSDACEVCRKMFDTNLPECKCMSSKECLEQIKKNLGE